jgi:hypothetical protein
MATYLLRGPQDDILYIPAPVLVVLNKIVKTFGKMSNLKFGLIRTRQLRLVLKHLAKSLTFSIG